MENSIIGRLLVGDSSTSSWQLNVADTISFCLILVVVEECGRSVVPNGGPTMPWLWRAIFLGAGIACSFLGRKGSAVWSTIWDWMSRRSLRKEIVELKRELADSKAKQGEVLGQAAQLSGQPAAPRDASMLIYLWRKMVSDTQAKHAADPARYLVDHPEYPGLRPYLSPVIQKSIEGDPILRNALIGSLTGSGMHPTLTEVLNTIDRKAQEWGVMGVPNPDRDTFEAFKTRLPSGVIFQLRDRDQMFKWDTTADAALGNFRMFDAGTDKAFLDEDMERLREKLHKCIKELLDKAYRYTDDAPEGEDRPFTYTDPATFDANRDTVIELTRKVVETYDELILKGRKRFEG